MFLIVCVFWLFYLMCFTARIRLIWHISAIWISISRVWPNLRISILMVRVKKFSLVMVLVLLVFSNLLVAAVWTSSTWKVRESSLDLVLLFVLLVPIIFISRVPLVFLLIFLLVLFDGLMWFWFMLLGSLFFQFLNKILLINLNFFLWRNFRIQNQWSHFLLLFIAVVWGIRINVHIAEVVFEILLALHSSVRNFAYFVTIKTFPLFTIKSPEKFNNVNWMYEIQKSVAHIALIFEIDRQIEEIVLICLLSVKVFKKHCLSVFVRYVFDHNGGSLILTWDDFVYVQSKVLFWA